MLGPTLRRVACTLQRPVSLNSLGTIITKSTMSHLADAEAPILKLEAKPHFEALSANHKHYAHYMSKASFAGTRVILRQVSPESETIYDLLLELHQAYGKPQTNQEWIEAVQKATNVSKEDVVHLLQYASQFLSNSGNYKSFGDSKFVPRISSDKFEAVASVSNKAKALYAWSKRAIYSQDAAATLLGFPDNGHVSGYYKGGAELKADEIKAVNSVLQGLGLMPENTRVFKTGSHEFVLAIASRDTTSNGEYEAEYPVPGFGTLKLQYGDHSREFALISSFIGKARGYATGEAQAKMLELYERSFVTGSMQDHKQSQVHWVKDIQPRVETNIGFIETYRDPSGVRGEWEGLVAMVNEEQTRKFGTLVERAVEYVSQLPWPREFEKDKFTPPDFTSLEVLTFAGSGIPAGINIPNYDDVRMNVGFKNVSLGNVTGAKGNQKLTFLSGPDAELYEKYFGPAFEVVVGNHELLGHGSGKLLSELSDGTFNFDHLNPPVNPVTGKPVTTYYKKGETWAGVFGAQSGAYEECRAECVAMYLAPDRGLLKIFGHEGPEADDIVYVSYLQMARAGLVGLEFWDPKSRRWGQPHMQARFSIMKCMLEAGQGFLTLHHTKPDFSDLVIKMDRSKVESVGRPAVAAYLQKLHVFKACADKDAGLAMFAEMCEVTPEFERYRDAVLAAKLPRRQFVQANTFIENGEVVLKEYDATEAGIVASFADRQV